MTRIASTVLLAAAAVSSVAVRPIQAQSYSDARAKQVISDAVAALGGEKFLEMKDRVQVGRAYSFYQDELSGLSVARISTRYLTVDPKNSGYELGIRERQAFGKKEDTAVVLREDGGANINWRLAKPIPADEFERYRESTLLNILYILRQRMQEPGLTFESAGSEVVDRLPCEAIDVIDSKNRKVRVYFHQVTKLPMKQVFSRLDTKTKERDEEVTRFDRYRTNDGIQWPQQVTRERNGYKIFQIFAESVSFNQDLTDDLFSVTTLTRSK